MSDICHRYIKRHCQERNGSYMKLLNTLSSDLEDMLTELYEERNSTRSTYVETTHWQAQRKTSTYKIGRRLCLRWKSLDVGRFLQVDLWRDNFN